MSDVSGLQAVLIALLEAQTVLLKVVGALAEEADRPDLLAQLDEALRSHELDV